MAKAILITRMTIGLVFGTLCMTGLFLLPSIRQDVFPQRLVVGFLGMPRYYGDPAVKQHLDNLSRLAGLLGVILAALSGALWFRDVLLVSRRLRAINRGA